MCIILSCSSVFLLFWDAVWRTFFILFSTFRIFLRLNSVSGFRWQATVNNSSCKKGFCFFYARFRFIIPQTLKKKFCSNVARNMQTILRFVYLMYRVSIITRFCITCAGKSFFLVFLPWPPCHFYRLKSNKQTPYKYSMSCFRTRERDLVCRNKFRFIPESFKIGKAAAIKRIAVREPSSVSWHHQDLLKPF